MPFVRTALQEIRDRNREHEVINIKKRHERLERKKASSKRRQRAWAIRKSVRKLAATNKKFDSYVANLIQNMGW